MPRGRKNGALALHAQSKSGVLSYVHIINQKEEFAKYINLGVSQIYTDFLPQPTPKLFQIKSSGSLTEGSRISNLSTIRGLTLVGISANTHPIKIAHYDSCGLGEVSDSVGFGKNFGQHVREKLGTFDTLVLLSHDSAVCNNSDISTLFDDTGLSKFREIGFRQPYVGLVFPDGSVKEYVGDKDKQILLTIDVANRT